MFTAFLPVIFLVVVFVAVFLVPAWIQRMKDNRQELIETGAKLVSKRIRVTSKYIVSNTYHVKFELGSQSVLELQVPAKLYNGFTENSLGKLRYQGKRFLSWKPNV